MRVLCTKFYSYTSLFVIFFLGCNSDKELVHFKNKILEINNKYYYLATNDNQTTMTVNGTPTIVNSKITIGLFIERLEDSLQYNQLKITYDVYKATIEKNEEIDEIDISDNKIATPTNDFLKKIKGESIIIVTDSNNKVVSINGYASLSEKLLAPFTNVPITTKQVFLKKLSSFMGNDFVSGIIDQSFAALPDSSILVGYSWQKQATQNGEIPFKYTTTYKLENVRDGVASISLDSEVNSINGSENSSQFQVNTKVSGKQKGEINFDVINGVVKKGNTETKIEGTIENPNNTIPISIKLKSIYFMKKL